MKRFAVRPLPPPHSEVTLPVGPSHHLLNVVRAARGSRILLFDGADEVEATLIGVEDDCARVRTEAIVRTAVQQAERHLVLGIPKAKALDLALRMATELGVTHLHPVRAARSVPRHDKHERWMRIVTSACEQCGRVDVPRISELTTLEQVLPHLPARRWVAVPGAATTVVESGAVAIAIGPEGGWTGSELARMEEAGFARLGLGPRILRTDTAVAAALARLLT